MILTILATSWSPPITLMLNGLTVLDENHRWCIFPILPINVQLSFLLHKHHCFIKDILKIKSNDCVRTYFWIVGDVVLQNLDLKESALVSFFSSVEEHLPLKLQIVKHIRASSCKLMQALPMAFTSRV